MSKKNNYRIIESKVIYQGHAITLVKDRFILDQRKDKVVTRELVRHPGASVILPMLDKKHILLLKQFRYAASGDMWEIPAGTPEKGESPLVCAKREIEEETGYKARKWKKLTEFFPAPGISDEFMTLYLAQDLVKTKQNLDHDEFLTPHVVSVDKALKMIRSGHIRDAKSIVALLWTKYFLSFILFLSLCLGGVDSLFAAGREQAFVKRVIDGDTIVLSDNTHVRLIGINCPEYEPWKNYEEPYGKEAKEYTKRLLTGKTVYLEYDFEKQDKYGRTLAYVYTSEGESVNAKIVENGLAYARHYGKNGRDDRRLGEAQALAKQRKLGLWSSRRAS